MRSIVCRNFVVVLTLALVTPGLLFAGHYYESVTTTQGEQAKKKKKAKASDTMRIRSWIDGPKAKVEFLDGMQGGFAEKGAYLLTEDAGETLYMVNPKDKTYSEWDLDALFSMAGNVMGSMGGFMKLEFSDFKNEKLLEEPGGTILGHPTTHYRYDTGYTMKMSIMGMKQNNRSDTLQDLWCTDAYDAAGFYVWLRPDKFRIGNEEFDNMIKTEMGKVKGFPLKTTAVTKMINKKGKEMTSTSTMEVTVLREEAIPNSLFKIPEGYEEQPMMAGMPEGYEGYGQQGQQPSEDDKDKEGGLSGLFQKDDG